MGAWGTGPFENDGAGDWEASLGSSSDLTPVLEAIEAANAGLDEYLEVEVGQQVIAACEALAVLLGRPANDIVYPTRLTEWAKRCVEPMPPELPQRASGAIDRILAGNSEYDELWAETAQHDIVVAHAAELKLRLSRSQKR